MLYPAEWLPGSLLLSLAAYISTTLLRCSQASLLAGLIIVHDCVFVLLCLVQYWPSRAMTGRSGGPGLLGTDGACDVPASRTSRTGVEFSGLPPTELATW